MKPAVIFDFDGTIADSFPVIVRIAHELLGEKLHKDDISRLRGLSGMQLLHALHIPLWRAWIVVAKIRRRMRRYIADVELIPGMDKVLRELCATRRLYVLSSNSSANVRAFLKRLGVEDCFVEVYGGATPWRKGRLLKRLVREAGLDPKSTWYVGDTDLDILAAHRVGLHIAAVAWGFSNAHVLESRKPDILFFDPDDLCKHFR